MIPGDEVLYECNESELLWLAREQGLPLLRPGIPHEELVAIVTGALEPQPRHLSPTNFTRKKLEIFIEENIDRLRGQLPGCNGRCTTWKCTEEKHVHCIMPVEEVI